MVRLLQAPRERAPWYNATGTTLYVLGMLASAFALRALVGGEALQGRPRCPRPTLGWLAIVRLGLVQTSLGSIVVLCHLDAQPRHGRRAGAAGAAAGRARRAALRVQLLRPRLGYGSDVSGRRTPWIVGGMAVLAAGGALAVTATVWMEQATLPGVALAVVAFVLIGIGVGAAGTALLTLVAKRIEPRRRPTAATIIWLMMIVGFIVTTASAGQLLDPFSASRLMAVGCGVAAAAMLITVVAVWGVEGHHSPSAGTGPSGSEPRTASAPFKEAIREVWAEPIARQFTLFVFVSMLGYGAQDLVLEPFAGAVFGYTPGESTTLSSFQYQGILVGMLLVGGLGPRVGTLRSWMVAGCAGSAVAMLFLMSAGFVGPTFPLRLAVVALGVMLGIFAVAAIGSMMSLVDAGRQRREGIRMGLFGGAQAIAVGLGGIVATGLVDLVRWIMGTPLFAYAGVFLAQGLVFLAAAVLAARLGRIAEAQQKLNVKDAGEGYAAGLGG